MKKMLTTVSEKWSEYLLEIFVITLGILGAFALNNWNENRLERQEERKILVGVRNDLKNTVREFEFLNEIRGIVLSSTQGILRYTKQTEIKKRELDSLLGLTLFRPTFNNKLGAINLLFTSGKINLIQNDAIRNRLIALPGIIEDMTEEEVYASNLFQNLYYPKLAQYIYIQDIERFAAGFSFTGAEFIYQTFDTPPFTPDYKGLLSDREYLNHLRMRASHMIVTNGEGEELIRQINELNELITQVLSE